MLLCEVTRSQRLSSTPFTFSLPEVTLLQTLCNIRISYILPTELIATFAHPKDSRIRSWRAVQVILSTSSVLASECCIVVC